MGTLTDAVNGLHAAIPLPSGRPKTYIGWGSDYFGGPTRFRLPDERDYTQKVGDGSGTSLITALVNWIMREVISARRVLHEYASEDQTVPKTIRAHPVLTLLQRPNPYYDGTTLNMATAASLFLAGESFCMKVRSRARRVVEYWWLPNTCIEPVGRGATFIDHYRYRVNGTTYEIDPADIVHRRFGLDPDNPRRGLSPIRGVLREVYTDEEAARFTAAVFHNLAFPGAVVVPGKDVVVSDKAAREEIRDTFDSRFGGEGRGRTIVLGANAEVKFLQWSPNELNLADLRDVPEERIAAQSGIPAAVVGFGTGMQQVKVGATLDTLQAMAWSNGLLPLLELDAQAETRQMLPEFIGERDLSRYEIGWDLSRVAALSDIRQKMVKAEAEIVRARVKKVDEARMALGLQPVGGKDGGFQGSPGAAPIQQSRDEGDGGPIDDEDHEDADEAALTPREREMAQLAAGGLPNKAIAARIGVSERTVERHLASAKAKLGVSSREELGVATAA